MAKINLLIINIMDFKELIRCLIRERDADRKLFLGLRVALMNQLRALSIVMENLSQKTSNIHNQPFRVNSTVVYAL